MQKPELIKNETMEILPYSKINSRHLHMQGSINTRNIIWKVQEILGTMKKENDLIEKTPLNSDFANHISSINNHIINCIVQIKQIQIQEFSKCNKISESPGSETKTEIHYGEDRLNNYSLNQINPLQKRLTNMVHKNKILKDRNSILTKYTVKSKNLMDMINFLKNLILEKNITISNNEQEIVDLKRNGVKFNTRWEKEKHVLMEEITNLIEEKKKYITETKDIQTLRSENFRLVTELEHESNESKQLSYQLKEVGDKIDNFRKENKRLYDANLNLLKEIENNSSEQKENSSNNLWMKHKIKSNSKMSTELAIRTGSIFHIARDIRKKSF